MKNKYKNVSKRSGRTIVICRRRSIDFPGRALVKGKTSAARRRARAKERTAETAAAAPGSSFRSSCALCACILCQSGRTESLMSSIGDVDVRTERGRRPARDGSGARMTLRTVHETVNEVTRDNCSLFLITSGARSSFKVDKTNFWNEVPYGGLGGDRDFAARPN
ncbi:hypothetical protein EVAR_67366_1 [Eumeta japonica]|uniref:Uncharacterized protein n=1 Tax=Eumeta variegata TaxID=151549 RepID=A0A4C1ZUA8_EUMVA|nr:hypothetical protein EVAR_67366_1 [Eumeta japonica]